MRLRATMLLFFSFLFLNAQTNTVDSLKNSENQHLSEKIVVHFDRPNYITGEIIFFTVYVTDVVRNMPLDLSKVAYIELLDAQNKPAFQTKTKLTNGKGDGYIPLPMSLNSGTYTLIAYTNWMKNDNPTFYFHQALVIYNTFKNAGSFSVLDTSSFKADFFVEGGNLVQNLKNNVVVKTTKNSNAFSAKGFLLSEKNDTIAKFKTNEFGFCKFSITPTGQNLKAVIIDAKQKRIVEFVQSKPEGYTMLVTEKDLNTILVNVQSTYANGEDLVFVARCQSVIKKALSVKISSNKNGFEIQKSSLGEGILQFELIDQNQNALCQRLYYSVPEYQKISIKPEKLFYGKREKVNIDISSVSEFESNLSISVFALDSLNLKLPIEFDEYIFSSLKSGNMPMIASKSILNFYQNKENIDNLMLAQSNKIVNTKNRRSTKTFLPEIYDHVVEAIVKDSITHQVVENIECYLSFPSKIPQVYLSRTNAEGKVFFETQGVYGLRDAIFQAYSPDGRKLYIEPIFPFSDKFIERENSNFKSIETIDETSLNQRSIEMQVNNVFSKINSKTITVNISDSLLFFGEPDEKYKLDDFTRFKTFGEVLTEFVPGIKAFKRKGKYIFTITDKINKGFISERPLVMLDGVPVFNLDTLMNFSPAKVKTIEILTQKYYWGKSTFGGIANFQTYDGDMGGYPIDKSWLVVDLEGLQVNTSFENIDYDNLEKIGSRKPDFRNLLYWNPNVKISENKSTKLSFYTSDKKGRFIAYVRGMDKNGKRINSSITFIVQ